MSHRLLFQKTISKEASKAVSRMDPCKYLVQPSVWVHKTTGESVKYFGEAEHKVCSYEQQYVIHQNSPNGPLLLTHRAGFYHQYKPK